MSPALLAYLLFLAGQRATELVISARNARRIAARGGREEGRAHFPIFVVLHGLFPILLVVEVVALDARPPPVWPAFFLGWLAAQALRVWAIRSLGDFWNVRVWVVPGMRPVRTGPYRFLRHPNYLAVVLELATAPLMFGAWRTALVASALNAVALATRIRVEEAAIGRAEATRGPPPPA